MNEQIDVQVVLEQYKHEIAELMHAKVILAAQLRAAYEEIGKLRQEANKTFESDGES